MNNKKVSFIYCVNDYSLFTESIEYIKELTIPEGFEIEIIPVEDAPSMTSGYNFAMKSSDAKYKVYLHQDAFIINKNFIFDIVSIFKNNPEYGMLGVAGAKVIPFSGVWWESREKYGKVFDNHTGYMEIVQLKEVVQTIQEVQSIDGLIMITQYDVPWKEKLIDDQHFYDLSQSLEFIEAGYKVGIPKQKMPWCIHDCGIIDVNNHKNNTSEVVDHYSDILFKNFPLVSILIPTYNKPDYFEKALKSAINQTYRNIEIIICDDSTNDETKKIVQKYLHKYKYITYIKNEKKLGKFENNLKLLNLANGDYINFLLDGDLLHPEKIEKMMWYLLDNPEISLVTSHQQSIDSNGNNINDFQSSRRLFASDTLINGVDVVSLALNNNMINFVGEQTAVLFRISDEIRRSYNGKISYNTSLVIWMNLLQKGSVMYISETLSYFRVQNEQQIKQDNRSMEGIVDFADLIINARKNGFINSDSEFEMALTNWLEFTKSHNEKIIQNSNQEDLQQLQKAQENIETEFNGLIYPKLEQALNRLYVNYDENEENLIIFIVPGEDIISGGILSIYSIYEETQRLKQIHHSETIMCTRPNDTLLLKNSNFQNDVPIYPFELAFNYFKRLKNCIIHIPECYIRHFLTNISEENSKKLKEIQNLQINILNQNIKLMPGKDIINKLFVFTENVTCTTAHKRYTNSYYRNLFGVPLHLFSTAGKTDGYSKKGYQEKEDILIVSPDPHPYKNRIIEKIKRQLPNIKIVEIRNMKFEEYKDWISRAKWAVTFGEGFDGYFIETSFSGAISFAVYNTDFFPENFQGFKTVFDSFQQMYAEITNVINELDHKEIFCEFHQVQYGLLSEIYNNKEYKNNIKLFYEKSYTLK